MAGIVDPEFRWRGIGTALLDEALHVCQERAHNAMLLVVPRTSVAGRALALRRGGTLDHSEHALQLLGQPNDVPVDPLVTIRAATVQDLPAVHELLNLGFGWRPSTPDPENARPASVAFVENYRSPAGSDDDLTGQPAEQTWSGVAVIMQRVWNW